MRKECVKLRNKKLPRLEQFYQSRNIMGYKPPPLSSISCTHQITKLVTCGFRTFSVCCPLYYPGVQVWVTRATKMSTWISRTHQLMIFIPHVLIISWPIVKVYCFAYTAQVFSHFTDSPVVRVSPVKMYGLLLTSHHMHKLVLGWLKSPQRQMDSSQLWCIPLVQLY